MDDWQHEGSTNDQFSLQDSDNATKETDQMSTISTPFQYYRWKIRTTIRIVGIITLYTSLAITIAVIIVCLTARKRILQDCHMNFKQTPTNPVEYDDNPRSVGVGDFNNDKHLDVVVTNPDVNKILIYFATNNGTYQNPIIYSTGLHSQPSGVEVAQLRNNRQLDIVVACFGSNSIIVFLGLGDGSFINHRNISTCSSRPLFIHIAHCDNDTFLDLVTADYGTDSITIFSGDGTGSFEYKMRYFTGYDSLPVSIVSGDFNNDNWIDLVVANSGTNNIRIFFGQRDGAFFEQKTFNTGNNSHPNSIVAGYFNNDVLLDIAVANFGTNSTGVFLNKDNGTFADQESYKLGDASPYFIGIGDVNKDRLVDLVVTNRGKHDIGVLLGHRNGSFGSPMMYSTGSRSAITAVVKDLNSDTLLDITVVNSDIKSVNVFFGKNEGFQLESKYSTITESDITEFDDFNNDSYLSTMKNKRHDHRMRTRRQYGQEACETSTLDLTQYQPASTAIVDINNDTYLDIIVGYTEEQTIGIFLGYGNGSFHHQRINLAESYPKCILVVDWNHDGILDIIFMSSGNPPLTVLIGQGDVTYTEQTIDSIDVRFCPKIIVDLNHDDQLDIIGIGSDLTTRYTYVFLAEDNNIFTDPIVYASQDKSKSLAIGDVNNDDQIDLIVLRNQNYINIYLGDRNGLFTQPTKYQTLDATTDIALDDLNNDTYLDIVVVSNNVHNNVAVFRGYGNGSFANPILYTTGYSARSPRIADINNDGYLDLVTVAYDANKLFISMGFGNGSFGKQMTCVTGPRPDFVSIRDLNDDSRLDIVVANTNDQSISVFILSPMQFSSDAMPLASNNGSRLNSIVIEDFNNDHILDIVVVNYGTKNIGVLLGHKDGSFQEQITFSLDPSSNPVSITVGDFNNDKQLDLAVANSGTNKIDLLFGDGTGMFQRQNTYGYTLKQTPLIILADDLNNDGKSELIVGYENSDHIDIYITYDTGNFTDHTVYSTSITPMCLAIGYFNNDTFLDVVFANDLYNTIYILFGSGNGSLSNEKNYLINYKTDSIAVGDLNNDTFSDIVLIHSRNNTMSILLNHGNGSFSHSIIYIQLSIISKVRVCHVNNDSSLDIITFTPHRSHINVFLGYGNGSFIRASNLSIDPGLYSEAAGDLNNDGYIDNVMTRSSDDELVIQFGYGNGTFVEQPTRKILCAPTSVSLGDLNKDNQLDIIVSNQANRTVSVLLGYGDGSFAPPARYVTGFSPDVSVLGDLNNDDQIDIVVVNMEDNTVSVLLGDYNQVFNYQMSLATGNGSRPRAFTTGDFNNDTHRDIAVVNSGTNTFSIFLGYGNGSFSNQSLYPTSSSPSLIATGDLNNDYYLDIVIVHSDHSILSIHLGDETGSFPNRATISIGVDSQPKSIVLTDFDNDSIVDIIIANYAANTVIIFIGLGNGDFVAAQELWIGYDTHPFAVAVGDFNSDKKLDFILANYGSDNLEIDLQTC